MSCPKAADPEQLKMVFNKLGQIININLGAGESRYIEFEWAAVAGRLRMLLIDPAQGSQEILNIPYIGH